MVGRDHDGSGRGQKQGKFPVLEPIWPLVVIKVRFAAILHHTRMQLTACNCL
jgi:hypothetical protein